MLLYVSYGAWHSAERRRTLEAVHLADLHNDSQTALLRQANGAVHALGWHPTREGGLSPEADGVNPAMGGSSSTVYPPAEDLSKVLRRPIQREGFNSKTKVSSVDQRFHVRSNVLNSGGSQASPREDCSPTGTIVSFISSI